MSKSVSPDSVDENRKQLFLKNLASSSQVIASAKAANLPLSTLYYWRDHDPEFHSAWMEALAVGYELLEMEMLSRARGGTDKHIYQGGQLVATVKEYNDAMAFKLLMAHKELVAMTRAAQNEMQQSASDIRIRLDKKLGDMRRRIRRQRALEQKQEHPSKRPNSE